METQVYYSIGQAYIFQHYIQKSFTNQNWSLKHTLKPRNGHTAYDFSTKINIQIGYTNLRFQFH